MSQPTFPTISPAITRENAINLILSSIAMEELGLSHVINAEGEKLQYVLGTIPGLSGPGATINDILAVNESVQGVLNSALQNQLFLNAKMQNALNSSVTQGLTGPTGATGAAGPAGATGATGATGAAAGSCGDPTIMTTDIGTINTVISFNEGGGSNQAFGALVFNSGIERTAESIAAYIVQVGCSSGEFQMAILEPQSNISAVVVAVTPLINSISAGIFSLPLVNSYTMLANKPYFLAVLNKVNGCEIGAISAGLGTTLNAPPINFRIQNISGFSIGDIISTCDVSVHKTGWLVTLSNICA
ncbi:hypothetical protein LY28_00478 [Ruminiclostridium sufflavum DSM 19573]|uniref:Collagen triple helix repeat protein n=1 Tax=Ruminiclostridium sufflavum DSM 19573 TaxID=1121337 RepID=A0A318XTR2_9FIRM|nr:hypothetical protein [Ruminiclostridium sufflavum]PYG89879.1 hypothetical protein LY28_00478 [Ruminiclostridium sufflavum DSM 19573]